MLQQQGGLNMEAIAGLLLLAAVIGGIYWDIRRIRKMAAPPPPKPAPLPIPRPEPTKEEIRDYIDETIREGEHREKHPPQNQMTNYEWAQVQQLIAEAQLDTASTMGAWIKMVAFVLVASIWPDRWWVYVPILMFGSYVIELPFEKALNKARARAEKLDNRW